MIPLPVMTSYGAWFCDQCGTATVVKWCWECLTTELRFQPHLWGCPAIPGVHAVLIKEIWD